MTKGYNFNHEMRTKLAHAAVKYLADSAYRVPLNSFVMQIEEPYKETIRLQDDEIAKQSAKIRVLEKQLAVKV